MQITVNIGTPRFLRRSYHAIHDRWGKAGVVLAVIALIAALTGTALAVKGGLTSKQKKEVAAIAKKYAKAGPEGIQGIPGLQGLKGDPGTNGTNGTNGANGKSIAVAALQPGQGGCEKGGTSLELEGAGAKQSICNGKEGPRGHEGPPGSSVHSHSFLGGSEPLGEPCNKHGGAEFEVEGSGTKESVCNGEPGPVTEVAPSGLTMRGVFSYSNFVKEELGPQWMSVSFPFRVENPAGEGPTFHYIRYMGSEEAESFGASNVLIVGPAAGTGTVYGPAVGTGDVVSGSKEVTSLNSTSGSFVVGQTVEGEGIPASAKIAAVGAGTLELTSAATETKSGDELTGLASDQIAVNVTSGEFVSGTGWDASPPIPIGQEIEAEGIPSEAIVTKVEAGGNAGEVVLTLSKEPTESKADITLTGKASKVVTLQSGGFGGKPSRGEIITGPGIPAETTINRVIRSEEYPRNEQVEISQDPTASATTATVNVSEPAGCKGSLKHPSAEPGNFCLFLALEEGADHGNFLNEGVAAEEVTSSPVAAFVLEGLRANTEYFTPVSVNPLGAEFHGFSWFPLTTFAHHQTYPTLEPPYLSMSEEEKATLQKEGKFEGTVGLKGAWAVTAP